MNQELKQKWIEALRSGKYKQGKGKLRNANSEYCCLGVLCDVVAPDDWEVLPYDEPYEYAFYGNCSVLPSKVQGIAAMDRGGKFLLTPELEAALTPLLDSNLLEMLWEHSATYDDIDWQFLTTLNDDLNFTFDQIATVIEHAVFVNPNEQRTEKEVG